MVGIFTLLLVYNLHLGWLFPGLAIAYIVGIVAWKERTRRKKRLAASMAVKSMALPATTPLTLLKTSARKHASRIGLILIGLALGLPGGYVGRDLQMKATYARQYAEWTRSQALWEAKYLPILQERK